MRLCALAAVHGAPAVRNSDDLCSAAIFYDSVASMNEIEIMLGKLCNSSVNVVVYLYAEKCVNHELKLKEKHPVHPQDARHMRAVESSECILSQSCIDYPLGSVIIYFNY